MGKIARIRTSDRINFKRCRRKWAWQSHLRHNLEGIYRPEPLWTGTGVHYALEDYHGENFYGHPAEAFKAFVIGCRRTRGFSMPDQWRAETEMAIGIMDYYVEWLVGRTNYKTYKLKGVPQLEVSFEIPLPFEDVLPIEVARLYDAVLYTGTIDRVVVDEYKRLWVVEYKTAKAFGIFHFLTDPQVTTYTWAGNAIYTKGITGTIYQQHKKTVPEEPRFLKSTGAFSTAKTQQTTHALYRKALKNLYGNTKSAPSDNIKFLNWLATQETDQMDKFIRRDFIERNEVQCAAEGQKILMEIEDILNPNLPLYPNPTRDCSWCDFNSPCLTMDDGGDWESELSDQTQSRDLYKENGSWQANLPSKQEIPELLKL